MYALPVTTLTPVATISITASGMTCSIVRGFLPPKSRTRSHVAYDGISHRVSLKQKLFSLKPTASLALMMIPPAPDLSERGTQSRSRGVKTMRTISVFSTVEPPIWEPHFARSPEVEGMLHIFPCHTLSEFSAGLGYINRIGCRCQPKRLEDMFLDVASDRRPMG